MRKRHGPERKPTTLAQNVLGKIRRAIQILIDEIRALGREPGEERPMAV
jgi:hypothetical protein